MRTTKIIEGKTETIDIVINDYIEKNNYYVINSTVVDIVEDHIKILLVIESKEKELLND